MPLLGELYIIPLGFFDRCCETRGFHGESQSLVSDAHANALQVAEEAKSWEADSMVQATTTAAERETTFRASNFASKGISMSLCFPHVGFKWKLFFHWK